ncbi:RNA methyltransferase [Balneola vulgaris]|uniref:RNA methyltransferase n=1 Tax=Balneola vulgaris TaxID=287535 RepID=UPI000372EA08|nr:RNA methyltransferase [Balneola vulgaris]
MAQKLSTKEILEENLANAAPEKLQRVKVVLHNIRSLHNVGSVFRSSDAFGISEIIISGYTPTPPRPEITKTAIGAEEFVNWSYVEDPTDTFYELKKKGYTIFGMEQTTNSIPLTDFDTQQYEDICIVMGNEVTGIDEDILSHIDQFIMIPQFGQKHSLNVSVAAAVMLYALLEKMSH